MPRIEVIACLALALLACKSGKKDPAPTASAATSATAAAPEPSAAAPASVVPEDDKTKKAAADWLKDQKTKPATGFTGMRVPGGCTVKGGGKALTVGCYMPLAVLVRLQHDLLVEDSWEFEKKEEGPKSSVIFEVKKGAKKAGLSFGPPPGGNPASFGEVLIMPR